MRGALRDRAGSAGRTETRKEEYQFCFFHYKIERRAGRPEFSTEKLNSPDHSLQRVTIK